MLPTSLQGLTLDLRKTCKNQTLFRSSALPAFNEKPSVSRDVYNFADFAPGPYPGLKENEQKPTTFLLQGLTQGLRKTNKNRALFPSSALPGLNEKPFLSRDVYNSTDFAPGPYPGLKEKQ